MNYYLHLNGNVGTESSASLARLVISVARVQFCPRPFVRHFTPPPVCPQQFQSHKAVGVCRGVCVCARLYLQYNWELLRWVSVLYAHRQPHLKRCQLLCEERTVLWTQEAMKYLSPFQIIYSASAFSLFQMDTHTHTLIMR